MHSWIFSSNELTHNKNINKQDKAESDMQRNRTEECDGTDCGSTQHYTEDLAELSCEVTSVLRSE